MCFNRPSLFENDCVGDENMSSEDTMRQISSVGDGAVPGFSSSGSKQAERPRAAVPFGKRFQQTIITIHRWIGIGVCVLMFTWFISGLVLAYVRWPAMYSDDKLALLKPIDWNQVR